jgi:serine/threonine protein kinase
MNDINKFLSLQKSGSLKFREVFAIDSRCFGVVSEYCSQGNLRQHLIKKKELSQTLLEMKQIAQHLSLMHQSKLSHGNLKPNNILVR